MAGRATFTIVKSTIVMKYATTSSANALHRWRAGVAGPGGRLVTSLGLVRRTFGIMFSFSICNQR